MKIMNNIFMNDRYFQYLLGLPESIKYIMDNFTSFDDELQDHYVDEIWYDCCRLKQFLKDNSINPERKAKLIEVVNEITSIKGFTEWLGDNPLDELRTTS